jgi:hypothetical protein
MHPIPISNVFDNFFFQFAYNIWSLITDSANKVFVVSNKGNIQALDEAVASRKQTPEPLISDGETIIECCLELVKDITYFVVLTFNSTTVIHRISVSKCLSHCSHIDFALKLDTYLPGLILGSLVCTGGTRFVYCNFVILFYFTINTIFTALWCSG